MQWPSGSYSEAGQEGLVFRGGRTSSHWPVAAQEVRPQPFRSVLARGGRLPRGRKSDFEEAREVGLRWVGPQSFSVLRILGSAIAAFPRLVFYAILTPMAAKKIATQRYNIIYRPEPEGGFTVLVPSLPGCITWGKTLPEAKKMAIEAIRLYIETLQEAGEAAPQDAEVLASSVDVPVVSNKNNRKPALSHA